MKADEIKDRLKNALTYGTSHPEAYMTKADALWEKHNQITTKANFLAALQEYGELVKAEAVKVCLHNSPRPFTTSGIIDRSQCAHAIKEMKLP